MSTTLACLIGLGVLFATIHGQDTMFPFASSNKKLVCYYQPVSYLPAESVPGDICTHLIYAFGTITSDGPGIAPPSQSQASDWNTLTSLSQQYPQLSIMLSLQKDFNLIVGTDKSRMQKFAANAVAYLRKYQFDGVDMDWEFPNSSQKAYYATFFQIMRDAVMQEAYASGSNPLLLSLALSNNQWTAQSGYDLTTIASNIDFATAMMYDFHLFSTKDNRTGYNSPLYTPQGESKYLSSSAMANYYLSKGIPVDKLLLGVPTYGRSWQLASSSSHGLHALAVGKGSPGPYRHLKGVYTYPDTCMALKQGAQSVRDAQAGAVYLYNDTTWVAYDDTGTVAQKVQWAVQSGLGGVGVWSMSLDDIDNVCGGGSFPLLSIMKNELLQEGSLGAEQAHEELHYKPGFQNRIHSV